MKQFITILLALFLPVCFLLAQNEQRLRVAIFDPSSSGVAIDEGTTVAVREIISATFVNTGKYTIVERSLLQQVMKEQAFSNTDMVDENQATELGRLAGANKVVVSVVTLVGGRNMLSIKVIDVKTATIDQQKTKIVTTKDLLDAVEPLVLELVGESNEPAPSKKKAVAPAPQPVEEEKPVTVKEKKPVTVKEEKPVTVNAVQQQVVSGGDVSLYFAGFSFSKNPGVKIYVDGVFIGTGTLNQGFSLSFSESYAGKHNVKVEWESLVNTKTYSIDTNFKKQFVFEYIKGGFGYEFNLKK